LLAGFGDVRYVWRHLPLTDVHTHAQLAAEASEAAAAQDAFWEMHDLLLDHQDALRPMDLVSYAEQIGLDGDRFAGDLRKHAGRGRGPGPRVPGARPRPAGGSPRTWTRPTCPACPARRPSSSTASATTAPTTSPRSRTPSRPRGCARRSPRSPAGRSRLARGGRPGYRWRTVPVRAGMDDGHALVTTT